MQPTDLWDEAEGVELLARDASGRLVARPRWDAQRRELRIQGLVVKRLRLASPNQERILAAFERRHWPKRIAAPLPQELGFVRGARLDDVLRRLNCGLETPLIHFGADRAGQTVCWRATCHAIEM